MPTLTSMSSEHVIKASSKHVILSAAGCFACETSREVKGSLYADPKLRSFEFSQHVHTALAAGARCAAEGSTRNSSPSTASTTTACPAGTPLAESASQISPWTKI